MRYKAFIVLCISVLGAFLWKGEICLASCTEKIVYKKLEDRNLTLWVRKPRGEVRTRQKAVMLFHGGGWIGGSPSELDRYAQFFLKRGFVTIQPEYRLVGRDAHSVFESVQDAKDALAFLASPTMRSYQLALDQVFVAGASAGGHLAFWATQDIRDDGSIAIKGLIMLSPVLDTSVNGFGNSLLGERWQEASPVEHINQFLPPTLIIHDPEDQIVPAHGPSLFLKRAEEIGKAVQIAWLKPGVGHGFYLWLNEPTEKHKIFQSMINFLESAEER